MKDVSVWLVIFGMAMVTIITRAGFLALGDRFRLPKRVQHALRYAPACALAALIAPELVMNSGAIDFSWHNAKPLAGAAAVITMLATRNMILTMVIGMAAFTALRLI